ncbi:aminotransferase class V-fold PLP-dependent enzyme [Chondromyces apiculatus]|uniref:Isopenicillin N epimerase n=1 Tax=Chondromyces apiculatus DSM 436 TaxID=1192034 RepID=A0A017T3S9_9BACT|nr:aminotransferase class V-fold PLP-dependent enzyme [Chondromyces apiculatus]EYF03632.1 isopenicillin N epimerase [Chondromyces apiculatus DSM 436]
MDALASFPPDHAADVRHHWTLDPETTFLNHGSFGACPRVVLEAQSRFREQMERQPVRFFVRALEPLLDSTRAALGAFVGADPDDLALVPNATAGVNAVLRSLDLRPDDELIVTNHEYNACRNALEAAAARASARVVVVEVPFPIEAAEQVVHALVGAVGPRTRLALVDHVTSQTGLVFPVGQIVAALAERGVDVLVDGAHAPGMLPLDLRALGAAYYTGNCHKWICTPKGAAFLCVRRDRQRAVRPLSISHGANAPREDRSRYRLEFDWTGTFDPTPFLCIPEALRFMATLMPDGSGWPGLMEHNRRKALAARALLCTALGCAAPSPEDMIGALASVPLPPGDGAAPRGPLFLDPLQEALFTQCGIEVPVIPWTAASTAPAAPAAPAAPRRLLRISAQIYNARGEYARLTEALSMLLPLPAAVLPRFSSSL